VPDLTEGQLQVGQRKAEDLLLDAGAAQVSVGVQQRANLHGQFGCEAPQQDLGEVVQQRSECHLLDVHVVAGERPLVRIARSALRT
jgi:hypothetical protein